MSSDHAIGSGVGREYTTAALAAAKARGKRLGTPDPAGAVERMRVARKAQAAQFGADVLPIIRDIQAAGHTSLNAIAGQLNARKVATANGGQRRHAQVRQILDAQHFHSAICSPDPPNSVGKSLNFGKAIAHRQNGLGVIDVNTRLELERRKSSGEYIDQTERRMIGH